MFKFIKVYFGRRTRDVVENGMVKTLTTFVYSSYQSASVSITNDGVTSNFSLTYWDGKPKADSTTSSSHSITIWLNGLTQQQADSYRQVYGETAILMLAEDGSNQLIPESDYLSKHSDTPLSTSVQCRAFVQPS